MGDHFVLLVDCLLIESTLEAAIGSTNQALNIPLSKLEDDFSPRKKIVGDGMFTGKLVELNVISAKMKMRISTWRFLVPAAEA
ncbi:hypothetical protein Cni_G25408 [Canna indica]|uniref:Uncharacterized protein n=1 Tax=Canna indica TaxID=4628 RepID=A0AAQ3QQF2_9LILI|nr:hypothetical protein Cni_G25408 [Canna indica]